MITWYKIWLTNNKNAFNKNIIKEIKMTNRGWISQLKSQNL